MMILKNGNGREVVCKYGSDEGIVKCENCPMLKECPLKNKKSKPLFLALL